MMMSTQVGRLLVAVVLVEDSDLDGDVGKLKNIGVRSFFVSRLESDDSGTRSNRLTPGCTDGHYSCCHLYCCFVVHSSIIECKRRHLVNAAVVAGVAPAAAPAAVDGIAAAPLDLVEFVAIERSAVNFLTVAHWEQKLSLLFCLR